jgi:hypothetical protein
MTDNTFFLLCAVQAFLRQVLSQIFEILNIPIQKMHSKTSGGIIFFHLKRTLMRSDLYIVVALISSLVVGCSATPKELTEEKKVPSEPIKVQQPIVTTEPNKNRMVLDFQRQGLRLIHGAGGEIEAIEVNGYAPVWGQSQNAVREAMRVAELEAKKNMNDFLNEEVITSSVTLTMITLNLEKSKDASNTTNLERDRGVAAITTLDEVESLLGNDGKINQASAARSDALGVANQLKTTITTNNKGILTGLFLVDAEVVDGGRNVRATYRWELKGDVARQQVRDLMRR